jgi:ATP-binding cassette subfamily B multidrug efflux pump
MAVSGKAVDVNVLSRIYPYVKPYKKKFYLTVLFTILLAALSPLRPWLVQYAVDHYIVDKNAIGLFNITALLIALLIFQGFIQFYHSYLTSWLGQTVIRDLRIELFKRLSSFRLKYFDHTPIGMMVTRLVSDMETIADVFSEGLLVIIGDILQLAAIIAFMLYQDWKLTLISLCTIPLLLVATNLFKNGIKDSFNAVRNQVARLNTFVQEHITGMSIVQIFVREEKEMEKFEMINDLHRKAHIKSVLYYSIFFPVVEILSAASIGLLVWWGAGEVIAGKASPGTIIAFIMYINLLFRPIRELADKFNTLQMGMLSSERIFKLLDSSVENKEVEGGSVKAENLKGEIKFDKVWFAYNDEQWVLKDVSFDVKPGSTLALVGATGAGKTSVISLLNRFYEINKGQISIDGLDVKEYELSSLRKSIAVVLQDVFLFSDTIENNISMRNHEIFREEMIMAAEKIGASKFISELPGNFDFNVMERGGLLSTGQRQLISFIRAFVQNPSILVLDEATSSIDSETETLIQKAISALTKGRTSIIIAHRLSTILNADRILVFEKGSIVEQGTHDELLALKGFYHQLYHIQFKNIHSQGMMN